MLFRSVRKGVEDMVAVVELWRWDVGRCCCGVLSLDIGEEEEREEGIYRGRRDAIVLKSGAILRLRVDEAIVTEVLNGSKALIQRQKNDTIYRIESQDAY